VKFDVYGRFIVEVIRRGGDWEAYRVEEGKRIRMREIAIPSETPMDQIPCFLDDLWHESASPGKTVRKLE
jgi:hypothetical protein